MTATHGEGIKAEEDNSSSVRTGTDNFPDNRSEKAATERTGGEKELSSEELYEKELKQELYVEYRQEIFPKINSVRGTTRLLNYLKRKAYEDLPKIKQDPTPISELEWDNLIILDACRHDLYEEVRGQTDKRVTVGSHSREFIEKTFADSEYEDTVYVTANPHFDQRIFSDITSREPEEVFHSRKEDTGDSIWDLAERGEISRDRVWEHYKRNLEYVLQHVDNLVNSLDGRTVITSDHGNVVGEKGLYHHPSEFNAKSLREVPLDVVDQ